MYLSEKQARGRDLQMVLTMMTKPHESLGLILLVLLVISEEEVLPPQGHYFKGYIVAWSLWVNIPMMESGLTTMQSLVLFGDGTTSPSFGRKTGSCRALKRAASVMHDNQEDVYNHDHLAVSTPTTLATTTAASSMAAAGREAQNKRKCLHYHRMIRKTDNNTIMKELMRMWQWQQSAEIRRSYNIHE
jgi:hypothetical protein